MRGLLTLAYCLISILTAGQVMFRSSLSVGISALAASALGFFGTATFFGSFLARREKKYSALDLAGIGAIALVLVTAAFGLMLWSGFSLSLDGVLIPGPYWIAVGMATALLATTKQHAL
jgi:TRAP-type C4-dicarboxylate transport system permease small subunit